MKLHWNFQKCKSQAGTMKLHYVCFPSYANSNPSYAISRISMHHCPCRFQSRIECELLWIPYNDHTYYICSNQILNVFSHGTGLHANSCVSCTNLYELDPKVLSQSPKLQWISSPTSKGKNWKKYPLLRYPTLGKGESSTQKYLWEGDMLVPR